MPSQRWHLLKYRKTIWSSDWLTIAIVFPKKPEMLGFVISMLSLNTYVYTHNQFLDAGDPVVVK